MESVQQKLKGLEYLPTRFGDTWLVDVGTQKNIGSDRYIDVSVSMEWLGYSNFYEDVINMVGYDYEDFVIDKDILSRNNKIYSKDTCCFVPPEINVALTKSNATRGEYMIGVDFHSKTNNFRARHRGHIGLFDNELEAFNAYKLSKENYLKHLATKYKNVIDERVYNVLTEYQVKPED